MSFLKSLTSRFKHGEGGSQRGPPISSNPSLPSEFHYHPLDTSKREIRVLTVDPWIAATASADFHPQAISDLHVTLFTVSLNDKPNYLPISYAWSKEKPMREVYVDARNKYTIKEQKNHSIKLRYPLGRQKLKIPEDVYDFLKFKVAASYGERHNPNVGWAGRGYIWIDQICINQKDLKERASQVGLMDQIYFGPNTTLIWLGFGGDDGELAVQFVDRIDHKFFARLIEQVVRPPSEWPLRPWLPPEHGIIEDPLNPRYWRALRALLLRTWWSRTWIIQESLLSEHAGQVTCCRAKTTMYKFGVFYSQFLSVHAKHHLMPPYVRQVFRGIPFTEFLARFFALHDVFQRKKLGHGKASDELSLLPLISFASTAGLTKPQDRVYALLGLCGKRYQENIPVDYEITAATAALQAFMYIIRTAGLGAFQLGKLVKGENMGLPSWMPDLGTTASSGQWFLDFPNKYYLG